MSSSIGFHPLVKRDAKEKTDGEHYRASLKSGGSFLTASNRTSNQSLTDVDFNPVICGFSKRQPRSKQKRIRKGNSLIICSRFPMAYIMSSGEFGNQKTPELTSKDLQEAERLWGPRSIRKKHRTVRA